MSRKEKQKEPAQQVSPEDPMFTKLESHQAQEDLHKNVVDTAEQVGAEDKERLAEEQKEIDAYLNSEGKPSEEDQ